MHVSHIYEWVVREKTYSSLKTNIYCVLKLIFHFKIFFNKFINHFKCFETFDLQLHSYTVDLRNLSVNSLKLTKRNKIRKTSFGNLEINE